jgi:glycosyltransferase involved in cell wall biosynthesis
MYSPLVSVIICNYNYDLYLKQAIESVLSQTYKRFELIVVDDGSTDKSREIITHYAKHNNIISIFKTNGGQASALNAGFVRTSGEIIAFMDSDDFWMPEKLEKVVEAYSKSQYAIVQHNHYIVDQQGRLSNKIWPGAVISGDIFTRYFIEHRISYFSSTSGIASLKKYLIKIFPLEESYRICADIPLCCILPLFGHLLTLKQPLGCYRVHSENNWMNTSAQAKLIENIIKYTNFLNLKFAEFGIKKKVDIKKGISYKKHQLNNCRSVMRRSLLFIDLITAKIIIRFKLLFLVFLKQKIYNILL